MTYVLTLCLGMTFGLCGQFKQFEFDTRAECEHERSHISKEAIGKGYAICKPKNESDSK